MELFQKAVDIGDLDAKAFAFYVDKLKIAKGEKQVYVTQVYIDPKKREWVEYPSIDPENLKKRRASVGF